MRHLARLTALAAAAALGAPAAAGAAFSPSNGAIAFERGAGIFAVAPSGGAATPLTQTGYDHDPAVSPDGNRIAYVVNRDVWIMRADGTGKRQLTTDGDFNDDPAWSPDGRHIVHSAGTGSGRTDLFAVPAAGGRVRNLTNTPDNAERNPAWSPDGRRIAYERIGCATPRGGGTCVYLMNADGSGQTNLTPEDAVAGCENAPGYYFNGASGDPAWSPDGRRIAFVGPTHCKVTSLGSDIWTMGPEGGVGKVNLVMDAGTSDEAPVYSPDGTRIAFTSNRPSGTSRVFAMPAGGGDPMQVTDGTADIRPSWGPEPHCLVPRLKGLTRAAAKAMLAEMGCRLGKVTGGRGRVASQRRAPGSHLRAGAKVAVKLQG